jgi:hypothetical protein
VGVVEVSGLQSAVLEIGSLSLARTLLRSKVLSSFCSGELAVIVLISESLLQSATAMDDRILRESALRLLRAN